MSESPSPFNAIWAAKRSVLSARFPWLCSLNSGQGLFVGCKVCAKARVVGPMAGFECSTAESIRVPKLTRHERSAVHQRALSGDAAGPVIDVFQDVWHRLRPEYPAPACRPQYGRVKHRNAKFCLAEAIRNRQREFLRTAGGLAIMQDAADTRQLIRFVACSPELNTMSGILGMVRVTSAGHHAVLRATRDVFQEAATPWSGSPTLTPVAVLDEGFYQHMRHHTFVWTSDAGPDEMAAASEARVWKPSVSSGQALLPRLEFVNRDKAHASRRVVKRPWDSDPLLRSVRSQFTGMLKLITNSYVMKAWYVDFQTETLESGWLGPDEAIDIRASLNYCAVRFDSLARPLATAVLTIDAVILTAVKNVNTRKGTPSYQPCLDFLNFISGPRGMVHLALAAMLADAACECLQLCREMDTEEQLVGGICPTPAPTILPDQPPHPPTAAAAVMPRQSHQHRPLTPRRRPGINIYIYIIIYY